MSTSLVGTVAANAGSTASSAAGVTLPAALQDGDIGVLITTKVTGSDTVTTPSGWTLVSGPQDAGGNACRSYLFTKVLTAAESSTGVTVTWSANGRWATGLAVVRGTSGVDVTAFVQDGTDVCTVPAFTPDDDDDLVVSIVGAQRPLSATCAPASGWTEQQDSETSFGSGSNVATYIATKQLVGQAATLQAAASHTPSSSTRDNSWAVAFTPTPVDVAPDAPVISSPTEGHEFTTAAFSISGSAQADSTVTLYDAVDDSVIDTATATGGSWTISLTGQVDGSYAVYATATDAGGESTPTADRNYTVAIPVGGSAGTIGDPLVKSLNRIAGTTGLDAAGAANAYAGTTGLEVVGALNVAAGNSLPNYLDLQGVLNQLAGTTGLGVDAAAASIEA